MNSTRICRESGLRDTFSLVLITGDGARDYFELARLGDSPEILGRWEATEASREVAIAATQDAAFADRIIGMQNTEYAMRKALGRF